MTAWSHSDGSVDDDGENKRPKKSTRFWHRSHKTIQHHLGHPHGHHSKGEGKVDTQKFSRDALLAFVGAIIGASVIWFSTSSSDQRHESRDDLKTMTSTATQVQGLVSSVASLQTHMDAMGGKIDGDFGTLNTKVDKNQADLNGRVDTVNGKIDTAKSDLLARMDSLSQKVDQNQAELVSLLQKRK